MTPVIGIDFDHTIIGYDDLLFRLAVERRLIPSNAGRSKKKIRDTIRASPKGDIAWQELQSVMYGPAIGEAVLIEGGARFIRTCRQRGVPVFIVSHKTAYSNLGTSAINFHDAATGWMRAHGFFEPDGLGFNGQEVFYEKTRQAKVARVSALGCTHFIDDLEETFQERTFPSDVSKVLYNPHSEPVAAREVRVCTDWDQIGAICLS